MVFVVYPQRSVSVAIIVFYTCVWIPIQEMRRALLSIITTYSNSTSSATDHHHPGGVVVVDNMSLPAARFEDLKGSCLQLQGSGSVNNEDEIIICSICLVGLDQEGDDLELMTKLPICNHIFHVDCIHKWVDRDRFTCPLCRSFLFGPSPMDTSF